MGRFLETALIGLAAAASTCMSFVDGQTITAETSNEKIPNVGFTKFVQDDEQSQRLRVALQTDNLLSGEGVLLAALRFFEDTYSRARAGHLTAVWPPVVRNSDDHVPDTS